ncbi:MAG: hypothetical protein OHK0029_39100 [Armatimonadaceae bacterium]
METRVAVFLDFENIKRAVDDFFENERVDLKRILTEVQRVTEGRITIKRAYADWGIFKDYRSDLLDNATEPVQAFALSYKGKNGADIRIAIDVMDVVLRQEDITHVALVSGDSDFTPLVMKLREFGRTVIGVGVRSNTSNYLAKSCDMFCYYDDIRGEDGEDLPKRSVPSKPADPVALLATALAAMGNQPVPGSALKTQMRKMDPMFDELQQGHTSFLDFLRSHEDIVDLYKPAVGDVTVAPKGLLGKNGDTLPLPNNTDDNRMMEHRFSHPNYTPYIPSGGIPYQAPPPPPSPPMTAGEKYRLWLRENNFRYVPSHERHEIIRAMYDVFVDINEKGEDISLKEAKDRLHGWFEENRPAVSWESVNSTVYHLFYTWCFDFDRSEDDGRQLWDRRTTIKDEVQGADDLILRCERGIVKKLWEKERADVDADALNEWLYEGDTEKREYVNELVRSVVNAPVSHGYSYNPVR